MIDAKAPISTQRWCIAVSGVDDKVALSFDWIPNLTNNCITFLCSVTRKEVQSKAGFTIDLGRLDTDELEQLHDILSQRHAGLDGEGKIASAISWLLDLSLKQSSNLTLSERQAAVRQMLLVP